MLNQPALQLKLEVQQLMMLQSHLPNFSLGEDTFWSGVGFDNSAILQQALFNQLDEGGSQIFNNEESAAKEVSEFKPLFVQGEGDANSVDINDINQTGMKYWGKSMGTDGRLNGASRGRCSKKS